MKIKQQKNIKVFLNEEFGEKRGNDLFNKQEAMLNELIKNTQNKLKNQMKTLIQTILPRIAMYKILSMCWFHQIDPKLAEKIDYVAQPKG